MNDKERKVLQDKIDDLCLVVECGGLLCSGCPLNNVDSLNDMIDEIYTTQSAGRSYL